MNKIWCLVCAGIILTDAGLSSLLGMDTDIWWHLASGRRFWQHGLELQDPFSFGQPQQTWVRIDWLFQVLAYAVYHATGLSGLQLGRVVVLLASAGFLFSCLRHEFHPRFCVVMLVASVWCQSAALRPATLSLFFTVIWVVILERARAGNPRWLWLLPPLTTLWFNLHVAALGGCLVVALYVLGHGLDCLRNRRGRPARPWLWVLPLCGLALLISPQPWPLVYLPVRFLLIESPWSQVILEVQTPAWYWAGTLQCRLLVALALLGSWQQWRKQESTGMLVTLVCGFLILSTYRHQSQFCAVLAPWVVFPRWTGLRWCVPLLAGLLALRALFSVGVSKLPLSGLVRRETFAETVAQLASQGPDGLRVFTDMNAGGHYLWCFDGRQKVFIDSRGNQVYTLPQFVEMYFEILLGRRHALALLDRFQVQAIANDRITSANSPLFTTVLPNSPNWVRVYADMTGELYCRKELVGEFPTPPPPPAYLSAYQKGLAWQREGNLAQAGQAMHESLQDYPQFPSAHQALAQIYLAQAGPADQVWRELARAQLYHDQSPGLEQDWLAAGCHWPSWWRWYCLPFLAL